MKKIILGIFILCLTTLSHANRDDGAGDIGGGDPTKMYPLEWRAERVGPPINVIARAQLITTMLNLYLKDHLLNFANEAKSQSELLFRLYEKNLVEDIQRTEYRRTEACPIERNGVYNLPLTTANIQPRANGEPKDPTVCVDVSNLAKALGANQITKREFIARLVGMFLHEHARHLGFKDENHAFSLEMAEIYLRSPHFFEQLGLAGAETYL